MLLARDAALLAARLGKWSVVAVSASTVVYSVPRHNKWVLMVHCRARQTQTVITLAWGHPTLGIRPGVSPITLRWSSILALDIWATVSAFGGADPIDIEAGEHRPRPVFFGHSTGYLVMLAARFVYWPHDVHIRLVGATWILTSRYGENRILARSNGSLELNGAHVTALTAQQSLGSAPQDPIFFALVWALEKNG